MAAHHLTLSTTVARPTTKDATNLVGSVATVRTTLEGLENKRRHKRRKEGQKERTPRVFNKSFASSSVTGITLGGSSGKNREPANVGAC